MNDKIYFYEIAGKIFISEHPDLPRDAFWEERLKEGIRDIQKKRWNWLLKEFGLFDVCNEHLRSLDPRDHSQYIIPAQLEEFTVTLLSAEWMRRFRKLFSGKGCTFSEFEVVKIVRFFFDILLATGMSEYDAKKRLLTAITVLSYEACAEAIRSAHAFLI